MIPARAGIRCQYLSGISAKLKKHEAGILELSCGRRLPGRDSGLFHIYYRTLKTKYSVMHARTSTLNQLG